MRISQRQARKLAQRVSELEACDRDRRSSYPGGSHIGTLNLSGFPRTQGRIEGVRTVGCFVVAVLDEDQLKLYAIK